MTDQDMSEVIQSLQPGERIRFVFADKPIVGAQFTPVLMLCSAQSPYRTLDMNEHDSWILYAAGLTRNWANRFCYEATVLPNFSARDFLACTMARNLLESIEKL